MISYNRLKKLLEDNEWAGKCLLFKETVDSTNAWLMRLAHGEEMLPDYVFADAEYRANAPLEDGHGLLAVSEVQESGRGRRGRNWVSPKGSGIWMSIILRPEMAPEKASMLTLVMAMAVRKTLSKYLDDCLIKWPNDIVAGGRKVCGILTEFGIRDDRWFVVCGIGINVNQDSFPDELKKIATSLYLETGTCYNREEIIKSVMGDFEQYYSLFTDAEDLSLLKDEYMQYLVNMNRRVSLVRADKTVMGQAEGIDDEGCLIVRYDDGQKEAVRSGEVSVRGVLGYV